MKASPPPLPFERGELRIEKLGGVREERICGGVSGLSQVSDKERISTELSRINSCIRLGLWSLGVEEQAERTLREAKDREQGPGLVSISPARMMSKNKKQERLNLRKDTTFRLEGTAKKND